MSYPHLKYVHGFPLSIKYKVLDLMFKALNDLAPAQSLWLHIFTHFRIHPTTLATPKLFAILRKSYSSYLHSSLFFLKHPFPTLQLAYLIPHR